MTAPTQQYVYDAQVVNVVDGDTVDMVIQLGFLVSSAHRMRLADVNAPEVHGPTRAAGLAATAFVRERLQGKAVLIQSMKSDSFGRWLVRIWIDGACFNDALVAAGHAVPYRVSEAGV